MTADDRPAWMAYAECRGMDPELFFPPRGGRGAAAGPAYATCAACPVRRACLDYALVNVERYGIWGGMNERQRRHERARRRLATPLPERTAS